MKSLLFALTMVAAAGMCLVSCRSGKPANKYIPPRHYASGTTTFLENTPPQFHQLQLGQTEEAVVKAVGKPNHVSSIFTATLMGKPPVGKLYTYSQNEGRGAVWIYFDTNMCVTGIIWRDRE